MSWAATLTGTITNGTTGKPAAGDEIVLIKLSSGMDEVGHTKTDAQGKFSFNVDDSSTPYLIRAIHQDVTYHQPAPPGTSSVDLIVYDVSPKLKEVHAVADVMYVQAQQGSLAITRVFAVDNSSKPPRTQMNDANFEFMVPNGAQIDEAQAQTAGGEGVNVSPAPQAQKGRYAFDFPLRPGQTQFEVSYHLPYNGKATVDPQLLYSLEHFVVILPKSMSFSPAQTGIYESRQPPPNQQDATVEIASNAGPGQKLTFDVSGEGMLQNQNQNASNSEATGGTADSRPGGGLGAPIEAPDPMDKYRPYMLGVFGLALIGGAIYIVNRSRNAPVPPSASASQTTVASNAAVDTSASAAPVSAPVTSSGGFLEGLKDELFRLELEHKQGQISDEEYAKAKAALDQTLARAVRRTSTKSQA